MANVRTPCVCVCREIFNVYRPDTRTKSWISLDCRCLSPDISHWGSARLLGIRVVNGFPIAASKEETEGTSGEREKERESKINCLFMWKAILYRLAFVHSATERKSHKPSDARGGAFRSISPFLFCFSTSLPFGMLNFIQGNQFSGDSVVWPAFGCSSHWLERLQMSTAAASHSTLDWVICWVGTSANETQCVRCLRFCLDWFIVLFDAWPGYCFTTRFVVPIWCTIRFAAICFQWLYSVNWSICWTKRLSCSFEVVSDDWSNCFQ